MKGELNDYQGKQKAQKRRGNIQGHGKIKGAASAKGEIKMREGANKM